ncbi:DUF4864 domain-containing protein [Sneathiella glossodoripedis]|uniref:DUF4864 domain-containing protein n=1 Tax=Sneathiella glossodoripedis TaxID=418853 RepID=UPI00046FFD53|nr:DUF4864 domain-containing protein [Sneathiella glossodoripedis]
MSARLKFRFIFYLIFASLISWGASVATAKAQSSSIYEDIIASQIKAFQDNDASKAFSFASKNIQLIFREPENFMLMVKHQYAPIYRQAWYKFDRFRMHNEVPTQSILIQDEAGQIWVALYQFERQSSGDWKISGVVLRQLIDGAA